MRSLFVFSALLALVACRPKPTPTSEPGADKPAPVEVEPNQPATPDSALVQLSASEQNVSVRVGTTLQYDFKSHASVGYGAAQTCSDENVVRYVRTDTAYEQSETERAGKPGSDAATGTFVFEAIATGTATVTVDTLFRGSTEESTTFTIVVTD